ncbi:hypothetical protein LTR62_002872 [Meristemomyces frigidus]|uniref:Protein kinase domain-containing protein n=1 Tax=Meristemomyces frigidus TaxID=1508187 RepID=A0AAN7TRZ2_9PEZI|nr:hypothetical protein LTR62_002872 [Meristemomyces frigidus]
MEGDREGGRELTSFRSDSPSGTPADTPSSSAGGGPAENNSNRNDGAQYIPDALDLVYRASQVERNIEIALASVYTTSLAIDHARFAGEGASFAVYRRRIQTAKEPRFSVPIDSGDHWTAASNDNRRAPDVVAYKIPRIKFTTEGRPTEATRHAMRATIMELYLTSNQVLMKHKNIVDFLGLAWASNPFDTFHKSPVLIVEYSELGSLAQLQRQRYIPISTRRKLCLDVCEGLKALHNCNVLHGDVKAENVLVFYEIDNKLVAKLSDFGYSHVLDEAQKDFSIGGTRPWQAPETRGRVLRANAKATDVYSLSLLCWCTLSHGLNVFKLLDSSNSTAQDFYSQAETLKLSGSLAEHLNIAAWYPGVLKSMASKREKLEPAALLNVLVSMKREMNALNQAAEGDISAGLDKLEELAIVVYGAVPTALPSFMPLFEKYFVPPAMVEAIALGLSLDPAQRDLEKIAVGFGGDTTVRYFVTIDSAPWGHMFQWTDWPTMEPWLQHYLAEVIRRRREHDFARDLINPPEALLLAVLYTNGYGIERDSLKAITWMRRAMRSGLHTATAYSYRHLTGLGYTIRHDNTEAALSALDSMAVRGSRTALDDIRTISRPRWVETRQLIRDKAAGLGANFFFQSQMLGNNILGSWVNTLRDIATTLPLLETYDDLAGMRINKRGDHVLHLAASCGQISGIEVLLNHFSIGVNQLNDLGETPLLYACRSGQLSTALWLLEHGGDATIAARNGESTLHWLVSFDEEEVLKLLPKLMEAGADVKAKTEVLIKHCTELQSGFMLDHFVPGYPVAWATLCDRPDVIGLLLSHMEDNPYLCSADWPRVNSAIQIAAARTRSECLRLMLEAIQASNQLHNHHPFQSFLITDLIRRTVFLSNLFDLTILHGVNWKKELYATLKLLIPMSNRAANLNGYDYRGSSLLYWAVSIGRDEVVEYLLSEAWEDMRNGTYFNEDTITTSDVGAFRPADINKRYTVEQRTPLLEAVRWNRVPMVQRLIEYGAEVGMAGNNPFSGQVGTWTAFHVLAHAGHDDTNLLPLLRDHGAAVDGIEEFWGTTESPLLLALQNDCFGLAREFVAMGAEVNYPTRECGLFQVTWPMSILGHVIGTCNSIVWLTGTTMSLPVVLNNARNSIARIRFLLTHDSLASRTHHIVSRERQWTALHLAAAAHLDVKFRNTIHTQGEALRWTDIDWEANNEVLSELLLRLGEHVDDVDVEGNTAMHLAVLSGNVGAVKLLLAKGSRVDIENGEGEDVVMLGLRLWAEVLSLQREGSVLGEEDAARKQCADLLSRTLAALFFTISSLVLVVKWARITVPEVAQILPTPPQQANSTAQSFFPPLKQQCTPDTDFCTGFPSYQKPSIHVVLKTGASERDKTTTILSTLLSCTPNITISSDVQDEINGTAVIDILATLPLTYALNNPEWSTYETQKEAFKTGLPVPKTPNGWKLDRFKFLPMVEQAFADHPDADWVLFTEADVYFFWDNLYRMLAPLDSTENFYIGSAAPGSNHTFFAYGGAGFILSKGLMHTLLAGRTEKLSMKYEDWIKRDCCGDALLAYVIREETGVLIQNAYPSMSGEFLSALGAGRGNWKVPLVSLHRVGTELMRRLWAWERCRALDEAPISMSTILDFTLFPLLRKSGATVTGWDNFSNNLVSSWSSAHFTAQDCARWCAKDTGCLQWKWFAGQCRTLDQVKQGHSVEGDFISGWDLVKLEELGFRVGGL